MRHTGEPADGIALPFRTGKKGIKSDRSKPHCSLCQESPTGLLPN